MEPDEDHVLAGTARPAQYAEDLYIHRFRLAA
jgi:hypothetical protein